MVLSVSFLKAQDSIPPATAAYLFDNNVWTDSLVKDMTGNGHDAYWYSYWVETGEEERPKWAGYREGKFGNAMKMNGFHDYCCASDCEDVDCSMEEQCFHTSSLDFLVFSGNESENQIVPHDPLFTEIWDNSFTIAYWYKSIRDYGKNSKPYPSPVDTADIGMGEVEYHVCFGDGNQGVVVRNFKGRLTVNIKGEDDEGAIHEEKFIEIVDRNTFDIKEQEWQHVAIIFDKDAGTMTAYLDGKIAADDNGFDASVSTDITKIDMGMNSAEFGTLNNATIVESLTPYWNADPTGTACLQMIDGGKLRAGWPYGGYLDDLVIYKDHALTEPELELLVDSGYAAAANLEIDSGNGNGNGTELSDISGNNNISIYPNPSDGHFYISGISDNQQNITLEVVNLAGQMVYQNKYLYTGESMRFTLPDDLKGIHTIQVHTENTTYTGKLLLK
jgi:hypothetical protein